MTTVFETEVCSSCHGTGRYSFNGEHSRCYKCDGKNGCRSLTARGKAASDYLRAKFVVKAEDVKIGDVIRFRGIKKLTVAKISLKHGGIAVNHKGVETPIIHYVFENANGLVGMIQKIDSDLEPGSIWEIRRLPTQAELDEATKDALAYQDSLTKAGKPRKR